MVLAVLAIVLAVGIVVTGCKLLSSVTPIIEQQINRIDAE